MEGSGEAQAKTTRECEKHAKNREQRQDAQTTSARLQAHERAAADGRFPESAPHPRRLSKAKARHLRRQSAEKARKAFRRPAEFRTAFPRTPEDGFPITLRVRVVIMLLDPFSEEGSETMLNSKPSEGRALPLQALQCAIAVILAAALLAAGPFLGSGNAQAATDVSPVSEKSWDDVKSSIEQHMGTPYVWGGRTTSGWDCSGFVSYVMHEYYGTDWPGGTWGDSGTGQIAAYCASSQVLIGSSIEDFEAACEDGVILPGDIIVFFNASGTNVHAAIAGEDATIYHAWSENAGTLHNRFSEVWGENGGHGKTYKTFRAYRGLSQGGFIQVAKVSADPSVTAGNPNYSLAGAAYNVANERGEVVATLVTDANGIATSSSALAVGTYYVREVTAPAGFVVDEATYEVALNASTWDESRTVTVKPRAEVFKTGGSAADLAFEIAKIDGETGKRAAQGAASLEGAVFEVKHYPVTQESPSIENVEPDYEWVVSTDASGTARIGSWTSDDGNVVVGIPLGYCTVREIQAPEGYLLNEETFSFWVTEQGESQYIEAEATPTVPNYVKRGDLELVKISEGDHARMANVAFSITSTTTGEAHVIVTDANGFASTASSWNPHSADTNGGTAESGVWFGEGAVSDSLGALPYDTYLVEEQRCEANAGYDLIPAFEVSIYKDSVTVNLGTLTNSGEGDGGDEDGGSSVLISKVDAANQQELPGATLRVFSEAGELVDEWTSGEEPHKIALPEGRYTLHEEMAPDGYLLASDVEFEVVAGAVRQTVIMVDEPEIADEPETTPEATQTTAKRKKALAQTGDSLPDRVWIPALAASLGCAAAAASAVIIRRKDRPRS